MQGPLSNCLGEKYETRVSYLKLQQAATVLNKMTVIFIRASKMSLNLPGVR